MLRKFWNDRRGQFAVAAALAAMPLFGGLALAIDYADVTRERQAMLNALDAAGIATAREVLAGASDADAVKYAWNFFAANFPEAKEQETRFDVTLPSNASGGGTLKIEAEHRFRPYFLDTFLSLLAQAKGPNLMQYSAQTEVRLKNTLEVALALDNSGSMDFTGTGSGKKRIDLLKEAAKQLVDTIAAQGKIMTQVDEPVRFSVVPFAASVNVGSDNRSKSWIDKTGYSPVQNENFDWGTMTASAKYAQKVGDLWVARGADWGVAQQDQPLSRFTLFDMMQRVESTSTKTTCVANSNGRGCTNRQETIYNYAPLASWGGCVEARPYPFNVTDEPPSLSKGETLFVPMFAPDETDRSDSSSRPANNNWMPDVSTSTTDLTRQRFMPKYLETGTAVKPAWNLDEGPNAGCSTKPLTKLTDVTAAPGLKTIKDAIDAMTPGGATNVTEGLAWGWRTVSSREPFTEGRGDQERGNDKIVIVLTDGANTYYTPSTVVAQSYSGANYAKGGNDLAGRKSLYSAYGYAGQNYGTTGLPRIFSGVGTGVSKTGFDNANYTKAMSSHFATLCDNAKAGNVILMTVALDLDSKKTEEKAQIDALSACSSPSRARKNADGTPAKLFWNATGKTLSDDFKSIADELSNLRIVS
ncbi:MAG: hypothetical protein INR68_03790 [Methylobacterium mesophilicum]|nr:hypothetical protein [Methylobacterium mesophilicum]